MAVPVLVLGCKILEFRKVTVLKFSQQKWRLLEQWKGVKGSVDQIRNEDAQNALSILLLSIKITVKNK